MILLSSLNSTTYYAMQVPKRLDKEPYVGTIASQHGGGAERLQQQSQSRAPAPR